LVVILVLKIEVYEDGKIKRWVLPPGKEGTQEDAVIPEEAWISDEIMPPDIIGKTSTPS
jgi:hypothetical protein